MGNKHLNKCRPSRKRQQKQRQKTMETTLLKMQSAAALLRRRYMPVLSSVRHYMFPRSFIQFLKNEKPPEHSQMDNGLNVVTLQKEFCHACVAIFADAGSRYENNFESGIAHLFEHLMFKATKSTPRDKMQRMINNMGIKLHAFTTRELVAYYAFCQPSQVEQVVTLLAECLFDNALTDEDISQQKHVIYEEIIQQDNKAKSLVFDYLHATAFQGTGLANSVIGTSSNLYKIDQNLINQYMCRVLHPCRVCLCAVGGVYHEQIVCLANRHLTWSIPMRCTETLYRFTGSDVRYRNDAMPKAHVAFALEGPAFTNIHALTMELAKTVLGGWDKTQIAGEDHAIAVARRASLGEFCDAYKAFSIKYQDTSLWGVQFVSSSLQIEDMLYTLQDVLMRICTMTTDGELERAKEELKSKLLYRTSTSFGAAKDLAVHMLFNCCHWPTVYDRLDYIDKISMEDFRSTVVGYVYDKCPAIAAVGPTEGLPDYTRIRAGQYWLRL